MKHVTGVVCICVLMLFTGVPGYGEEAPREISFRVGAGLFVANKADNLWGSGHRAIQSLNQSPQSSTVFLPLPVFDAKFAHKGNTTGTGRTTFYFNAGMLEPGSLSLGVTKGMEKGAVDIYLFYSLISKAWENPYVPYRDSTRAQEFGGKISYLRMFGSNFNLSYRLAVTDIQNDVIGELNRDLQRDGFTHTGALSYHFRLSKVFSLVPAVSYEMGAFKGKSNSYDQGSGSLALNYTVSQVFISTRVSAGYAKFDRTHPIYNRTRDEKSYGLSVMANIQNPFGLKGYFLTIGSAGQTTDSNIRFFDRRSIYGFVAGGYNF